MKDRQWQSLAIALISVISALVIAYLAIGRDIVTEQEVRRIVETEAPYVEDRQLLQQAVANNTRNIQSLDKDLREIQLVQARMIIKLDLILAAQGISSRYEGID